MALRRAAVGAEATPVRILDALAGCVEPVEIDRWPEAEAYDTTYVDTAPHDALDPYCDAALYHAAAAEAQACRAARLACAHWWTERAVHVQTHPVPDGAQAVARAERGAPLSAHGVPVQRLVTNASGTTPRMLADGACTYLLPPRTGFLLTNLLPERAGALPEGYVGVRELVDAAGGVDVVVLDPPWPNKSVERAQRRGSSRHGYRTLVDLYDIWRVRPALEPLLAHRPLVAIWITNHPKVHKFVRDKFFRELGLTYCGVWAWLKLAQSGAPLLTLAQPRRRRPYELLVCGVAEGCGFAPPRQVLASVALAHSQKPNVAPLLLEAAGRAREDAVVVELFARQVPEAPGARGWHVSVGNEALRFNARGV